MEEKDDRDREPSNVFNRPYVAAYMIVLGVLSAIGAVNHIFEWARRDVLQDEIEATVKSLELHTSDAGQAELHAVIQSCREQSNEGLQTILDVQKRRLGPPLVDEALFLPGRLTDNVRDLKICIRGIKAQK